MSKAPLTTYLRTHRKRSNLSQEEVGLLIAALSGATVSRHEASSREPSLGDGLAYEALFGLPASALFPEQYEKARAQVETRALELLGKLRAAKTHTAVVRQKILFLEALLLRLRS